MKMTKLVGRRLREDPKDAKTVSHKFLLRGGYIRALSTGIYTMLPLAKRVQDKVENIIREEMNAIDGQEVMMPVVNPADIWIESGRYHAIAEELLRFKDRNDKDMVLAMAHEEAVVHIARTEISSYKQLPAMMYQIQTKYRDEARPRAGLIRVREFRMKDAYSFHTSQECLEQYYRRCHKAYENIFARAGLRECISIESDTGMIGGSMAHEFMAVADCGEDTIFLSPDGKYKANRDIAVSSLKFEKGEMKELKEIHTPDAKKIEEIAAFLGTQLRDSGKCVCYVDGKGTVYMALVRGDFEINEVKLKKIIGRGDIKFANDDQIRAVGGEPGYISPYKLDLSKIKAVVDTSVAGTSNLIVGANRDGYHMMNFNLERDLDMSKVVVGDIHTVRAGDPCPVTGQPLVEKRGIEVGNIFQLGTKYSKSMNCNFLDQNGKSHPVVMGCYGIGPARTMAAVIEQNYDDYGPIWPITIAPYHVNLLAINPNKEGVGEFCDKLYADLQAAGIEVLYDDRGEKPGVMFNDADLIGVPFRVVVSPKNLPDGKVEFKRRGEKDSVLLDAAGILAALQEMIRAEMEKYKVTPA